MNVKLASVLGTSFVFLENNAQCQLGFLGNWVGISYKRMSDLPADPSRGVTIRSSHSRDIH